MSEPKTPAPPRAPAGLSTGGRSLWRAIVTDHPHLDAMQMVQLTEACRQKDRLDEMDRIIQGKGVLKLMQFRVGEIFDVDEDRRVNVTVKFDAVIDRANSTANTMKQLLAALRLADDAGKRPQQRGPRGAQRPTTPGGVATGTGKVSSLDRARARAEAKTGA